MLRVHMHTRTKNWVNRVFRISDIYKKLLFLFSMHLPMKSLSEISLYNCRKAMLWIHEGCKLYKHGVSHTSIAVHQLKMIITQQSETNHSWPYDVHCPLCVKITARLAFLWICHSCTTFGSAARYWHLYVAEEYMCIIQTWLANMPLLKPTICKPCMKHRERNKLSSLWNQRIHFHFFFFYKRLMIGPEPWNSELQKNSCVCYVVFLFTCILHAFYSFLGAVHKHCSFHSPFWNQKGKTDKKRQEKIEI